MDAWTRRTFAFGIAACGCAARGPHVFAQGRKQPSSLSAVRGCRLSAKDMDLMGGRGLTLGLSFERIAETGGGRRTTGNPEMDRALDRSIKRLADTFEILPGFGFFDDKPTRNAFAVDGTLPQLPHTKGTVLYGETLFKHLLGLDPTGAAVMWVMAHEFAHVWLFQRGDIAKLGPDASPLTGKRIELHADYLAGFYVGQRKRDNPSITLMKTGAEIWKLGDTNFNHPDHHGTPAERLAAAEAGFHVAFTDHRDAANAYKAELDYVLRL